MSEMDREDFVELLIETEKLSAEQLEQLELKLAQRRTTLENLRKIELRKHNKEVLELLKDEQTLKLLLKISGLKHATSMCSDRNPCNFGSCTRCKLVVITEDQDSNYTIKAHIEIEHTLKTLEGLK